MSPMERKAVFMRKFDGVEVNERNVGTWFGEYDVEMDDYKEKLYLDVDSQTINETMICDTPAILTAQLTLTRSKANIVR